jgi:maleylacetoacetate isomerase
MRCWRATTPIKRLPKSFIRLNGTSIAIITPKVCARLECRSNSCRCCVRAANEVKDMRLYSFWRSQATFRVRIALGLKGLETEMIYVDLLKEAQAEPAYQKLNPAMLLPTLVDGTGPPLVQSLAIMEYLDEVYPEPPLLPKDPRDRAHVRALAHAVAIDAHPFVVPRVRNYLRNKLQVDEPRGMQWLQHWLDTATGVVEKMLSQDGRTGRFCWGNAPSLADACLFPHMTSAQMLYGCNFDAFPTVRRIFDECMKVRAFAAAHPKNQADAAT